MAHNYHLETCNQLDALSFGLFASNLGHYILGTGSKMLAVYKQLEINQLLDFVIQSPIPSDLSLILRGFIKDSSI